MIRKIGILGGTFNPIHLGHVIVARAAMEQYGLDEIHFMTGGMPPHKSDENILPAAIRHEMVSIAVSEEDGFVADDFEVNKTTYSYTAETLLELKKLYPDDEIYFIIGEDSLHDILSWYRPEIIIDNCILLVYPRGANTEIDTLIKDKHTVLGGDIRKIEAPLIGISSTEIRNRIKEGKSVRYLITDDVIDYISKHNLYSDYVLFDEKSVEMIKDKLSHILKRNRYKHSLGVSEEAVRMAELFGADREKAYIAGLLHDCAKCFTVEGQLEMCKEYNVTVDEMTLLCPSVLHAPLGAAVAMYEYNVHDNEILDAIRYHTAARKSMKLLDKIIYVADMTEPSRDYDGVNKLRKLSNIDIDSAYKEALRQSLIYNIEKGTLIHPNTLEAWNDINMDENKKIYLNKWKGDK